MSDFPRVTEILRPFTNYDKVPQGILESAAARGTSTHAICAGIAKGAWIPDGMIQEELIGYVESFKKWSKAQVEKFIVIEKRFQDDIQRYTGQLDFVILGKDNQLYLVDIKTSSKPQKTYPVQLAAYDHLLKNNKIEVKGAFLVYLNKHGEFPEIQFIEDLEEELQVFLSALQCWHYFKGKKKNGRKRKDELEDGIAESH